MENDAAMIADNPAGGISVGTSAWRPNLFGPSIAHQRWLALTIQNLFDPTRFHCTFHSMSPETWIDFWKTRDITPVRDAVWRMSMDQFVASTESVVHYSEDDVVLDIGCGAGYLEAALHDRVREIRGVDVSEKYLSHCKEKLAGIGNCHFHKLDENAYTNLDFLEENYFTKIICLSVIQYYRRPGEVRDLLEAVRRVAKKGAVLLIADVPTDGARLADLLSTLVIGWRRRRLMATLRFFAGMRTSGYRGNHSELGLLQHHPGALLELSESLALDSEIVTDQLTVNRSRYHMLTRF